MIRYHIYVGDNNGGLVDYSAPVGDSAGPPYVLALSAPSITNVAVRAYDDGNGMEERNTDCVVRVEIDAQGRDVTVKPPAPVGLTLARSGPSSVEARWRAMILPNMPQPDHYSIYMNEGGLVDFSRSPVATVPYVVGMADYRVELPGLTGGTTYAVGVRAAIGAAEEENTAGATVVARGNPPSDVSDLTVHLTFA